MTLAVGLTRDMRDAVGGLALPGASLARLDDDARVTWRFLDNDRDELQPGDLAGLDALLHRGTRISRRSLAEADRLALVARHGVGLDAVDVDACTDNGVAVAITPDGVRRPMAAVAVAYILALAYRLKTKDALAREPGWPNREAAAGLGLGGRTVGLIGLGTIGGEIARMLAPFACRLIASTPTLTAERAALAGVEARDIDTLLRESDVVCVVCPATPSTRHLLDRRRLALLRPTAVLVNIARGSIVDQRALTAALAAGRLAGAALDVFDPEPIAPDDPLLSLDDVLLAPHSAGASEELSRGCIDQACEAILSLAGGQTPRHLANPEVVATDAFRRKLAVYAGGVVRGSV